MRLAFVGYHPPQPEGSAAGRQLWAVGEALRADGHEVSAWCWAPSRPRGEVADWCVWRPVPRASAVRVRGRALLWPRSEVVRSGWRAPDGAVAVADDPGSAAAVAGQGRLDVTTVHFAVGLDRAALRDRRPAVLQDWRGERRAVRRSSAVWSLSERVRDCVGRGIYVPPTIPLPAQPVPPVEEPVAGLLADWSWGPNVLAADALVRAWPQVRAAVPGARLLLAGRGPSPVGSLAGVEWLGEVPTSADLFRRTAVFAFPCPATSGPKMKVMDAFAHGVPVVTTAAGVEGLAGSAAVVTDDLARELVGLLRDPAERARRGAAGRVLLQERHAPAVAARARVAAVEQWLEQA